MARALLLRALRNPQDTADWPLADWDLLLRQAAAAQLQASLAALLGAREPGGALPARLPERARAHLEWARMLADRHAQAVRWEVREIQRALAPLALPVVLLKGAAYVKAGLPMAEGRLFSDIDILVPKASLADVEAALMLHGWAGNHHDAYDQRYYREWMHELPPMQHVRRQSLIDVHHAILPPTARVHPDPALLLAAAQPVAGEADLLVLAPADLLLHSATHLFYGGEFEHGLRDLLDLHRLLLAHLGTPRFQETLIERARELELARPLFYALRYCRRLLHTPLPPALLEASAGDGPSAPLRLLMDQLFQRALLPAHPSCDDTLSAAARFLLYIRGNWLRMPPLMLARHLFHKAFLSPKAEADNA